MLYLHQQKQFKTSHSEKKLIYKVLIIKIKKEHYNVAKCDTV